MKGTILICDDHPMVLEALSSTMSGMFPEAPIIEVCTFPDAWSAAKADVGLCICDLVMPGAEPIEGIGTLRSVMPATPLLVVTGSDDDQLMMALLNLGVSGFLSKTASGRTIRAAIDLILSGERHVPARLLEVLARPTPSMPTKVALSDQQVRVMALVSHGLTNKEIARELSIAPSSVKSHLDAAFRNLGARNRLEAVDKARGSGAIR
ncbi:MAG: response regulator transcription factor [Sphingomonas bacterium]|nr:response regulator transcription factor [Sphingomonas bacterium]